VRGSTPRLSRILSVSLALSIAVGWPAWSQQTQTAPAKSPEEAQKVPPPQPAPATAPQTQTAPEKASSGEEKKEAPAQKGATLKGRVIGADRRTPLPAAVVHAVTPDGTVVSSVPADEKGNYVLEGLAPGTYMLAVSAEEGVFSLESPVGITSARTFRVDLAAVPAEGASFSVPGLVAPSRGFCYIVQGKKPESTTFWRSPKGIVLLGVTAGAIGLILAESGGSDEEEPVSPSAP
jgi:hypothetical protein